MINVASVAGPILFVLCHKVNTGGNGEQRKKERTVKEKGVPCRLSFFAPPIFSRNFSYSTCLAKNRKRKAEASNNGGGYAGSLLNVWAIMTNITGTVRPRF